MDQKKKPPHKDEIAHMEPFDGLSMDKIFVVTTPRQADEAVDVLMQTGLVGFDTESKPTFRKGEVSKGPHVIQFSTLEKAYIFQSHFQDCLHAVELILKEPKVTKIGFGLKSDLQQISSRFGIQPNSIVDLDRSFHQLGYQKSLGAKSAVALLFQRKLTKSKSVTISNWAAERLRDRQLLYAANDAYAAIQVYHALQKILPASSH